MIGKEENQGLMNQLDGATNTNLNKLYKTLQGLHVCILTCLLCSETSSRKFSVCHLKKSVTYLYTHRSALQWRPPTVSSVSASPSREEDSVIVYSPDCLVVSTSSLKPSCSKLHDHRPARGIKCRVIT